MSSRPKNKDEYRQRLADAFAHVLEEQGLEWKKDWSALGPDSAPYNGVTKANYRGSNAFYLSVVSLLRGYNDPRWVTMVQIMDRKGKYHAGEKWRLKKGTEAVWVEYWYPYDMTNKRAVTWPQYRDELNREGRSEEEFRLSANYYAVYNASQVEGMPPLELSAVRNQDIKPDALIATLSQNMGVPVLNDGGDRAFYLPGQDTVHLPAPEAFESSYAYNATALHELAHATGHPSRLNRNQSGGFGSVAYAYEELVAEMASCFMGAALNAQASQRHIDNHKAYVQNWIKGIREKPETLIRAIKDAQGAADYMDYKAELITEKEYQQKRQGGTEARRTAESAPSEQRLEQAPSDPKQTDTAVLIEPEARQAENYTILAEKSGFILARDETVGNRYFFDTRDKILTGMLTPVNQYGTLEEIETELTRWKTEIDSGNPFMLEVEDTFLAALAEERSRGTAVLIKPDPERVPYSVQLRNPRTGQLETYTTVAADEQELERGLEVFRLGGYTVVSAQRKEPEAAAGMEISIYQITTSNGARNAFLGLESLERLRGSTEIHSEYYTCVFTGTVDCENLEDVYRMFNVNHPQGYKGRSLSVSDVVHVRSSPVETPGFYFCDNIGFKAVPFDLSRIPTQRNMEQPSRTEPEVAR